MKKILFNFVILTSACLFTLSGCKDDFETSKEQDEQELMTLFKEIETLAGQFTCNSAAEWKFVAVGAKACGGATAYVAYSSKVDESLLLKKVSNYTAKQTSYNEKWKVISDCMLVIEPKGVECNNGKPKFVY